MKKILRSLHFRAFINYFYLLRDLPRIHGNSYSVFYIVRYSYRGNYSNYRTANDSDYRHNIIVIIIILLHCALSLAAQCIVIGPVCGRVCNGRTACLCVYVCGGLLSR